MAHFAQLDNLNKVIQVIVISNDDLLDTDGKESETLGIQVCKNIFGNHTKWVQTSYNNTFRKQYAGIGMQYDDVVDVFYDPHPPFPSWSLDANFDWQPPTAKPNDGNFYYWDENTLTWVNPNTEV